MRGFSNFNKHANEVFQRLRGHKYEVADAGALYIPEMHVTVGGAMATAHRPLGGAFGPWEVSHNLVPTEGLIYMVGAACAGVAQITQFYIAAFAGNVTPAAGWTGANFASDATEFTAYTAATRLPWTVTAPVSTPTVDNGAAIAAATMTFSAGGPYNLYGAGVLSAAAKSATANKLLMAVRFTTPRLNMQAGDELAFHYGLTMQDAG